MQKILLVFFIFCLSKNSFSQYISYEYTQILIYSVKINYTNNTYKPFSPDMDFYGNALAQMQARYDRNRAMLSNEYFKLKDLKLINTANQAILDNYKAQRLVKIHNAIKYNDLGNDYNTNQIKNYCCEIYSYPSIKNEITLLQSCQNELNRIKNNNPDNFIYSVRYQSIMKTLDHLKNCPSSEIIELSWERTELENQNNKPASENNSVKSNYSTSIIGKPIVLGDIEVAQYNFPEYMNWYDAKKACSNLGNGWRLPTDDELWNMYLNREKIGNYQNNYYWSSTEYSGSQYSDYVPGTMNFAIAVNFKTVKLYDTKKTGKLCVRAVRDI